MIQFDSAGMRGERSLVLVIDDSPEILALINGLLRDEYRLRAANGGEKGLQLAADLPQPDLILLDVLMPDLDGHAVCRRLKDDPRTRHIPVIFLTARSDEADEEVGLALGAVDYIAKPINGAILRARVKTQVQLKRQNDMIKGHNVFLAGEVGKRAREIEFIQDVTILAMASLAETRDNETGNHIRRTQHYVKVLAEKLEHHPHFSLQLTRGNIELIYKSAPLHDIGKIGIPDHILLKPGRLDAAELDIMRTHARIGYEAITQAENEKGQSVPYLAFAKQIAHAHHEKWDGSGYPLGLSGTDIPVAARLMAVADVYDALISHRVYKRGMSHADAVRIIREGRGSHFDPDVVDAFLALEHEFAAIAANFRDAFPGEPGCHTESPA